MTERSHKLFRLIAGISAIFTVFLMLSFNAPADGKLIVSGKLRTLKGKALDSTKITITDSTGLVVLDSLRSNQKGRFKINLEYNNKFRIYFEREHFIKSYIAFDTKAPNSILGKDKYFLAGNVTLYEDSTNVMNKRAFQRFALMNVEFNKSYDEFMEKAEDMSAFAAELSKPNLGEMIISGIFQDTLSDSFNVKVMAKDTLGLLLAETQSEDNGFYSLTVPLEQKIELHFDSEDHYSAFAMVNSFVPEGQDQNDYSVKQNFVLVNKTDTTINEKAFEQPIARIEHLEENGSFVANPLVAEAFNDQLLIDERRIALSGKITDQEGKAINNVLVQVKVGDRVLQDTTTESNRFEVLLPYEEIVHVSFRANEYHESFISFNTNVHPKHMSNARELDTDVSLYSREKTELNPMAFQYPTAKFYYSKQSLGFVKDNSISESFLATLNSTMEKPDTAISTGLVTLTGQVFDPGNKGKSVADARVRVLDKNKELISAMNTDKRGNYHVKLGLNKVYFLEVEKDGFLPTQIRVNTTVPSGQENTDLPDQEDIDLLVVHPQNVFEGGKMLNEEFMKDREVTAFYYEPTEERFIEDEDIFAKFEEDIRNYTPPSKEIPAVTTAILADAAKKKEEKEKLLNEPDSTANAVPVPVEVEKKIPELRLAGKVVDERNLPLEGVSLALYEGRKKREQIKTDSLGNYNMPVPVQKDMVLKVESKNLYPITANVNTTYPDSLEPKSEIITMPTLKTYTTSNVGINSKAFDKPWQSVAYNSNTNSFKRDENTENLYAAALKETPDNQYVMVDGKAKDQDGRNIGSAKIVLRNNGVVVDSAYSDKRGRYRLRLDYQKDYRIEVIKQGFHSTFAAVSTNTNNGKDRLTDKRVKSLNLLLVNKEEANINKQVFYRPYAQVAYNAQMDEFVEVDDVHDSFLADLYLEVEKNKKEFNVKSTTVASSFALAEKPDLEDYVAPVGASTEAAKRRNQNRGQAQKTAFMGNLHDIISGLDAGTKKRIQNVSLNLEQIYDARRAINPQQQKEVNESLAEAAAQRELMSNLIAQALGMRRDADLVSTDSTFNVNLRPRIKHFTEGTKVYEIIRDQVYVNGEVIEYVETWDWFIWPNRYRNNKKISKSQYIAELDSIKNIGFMIE